MIWYFPHVPNDSVTFLLWESCWCTHFLGHNSTWCLKLLIFTLIIHSDLHWLFLSLFFFPVAIWPVSRASLGLTAHKRVLAMIKTVTPCLEPAIYVRTTSRFSIFLIMCEKIKWKPGTVWYDVCFGDTGVFLEDWDVLVGSHITCFFSIASREMTDMACFLMQRAEWVSWKHLKKVQFKTESTNNNLKKCCRAQSELVRVEWVNERVTYAQSRKKHRKKKDRI